MRYMCLRNPNLCVYVPKHNRFVRFRSGLTLELTDADDIAAVETAMRSGDPINRIDDESLSPEDSLSEFTCDERDTKGSLCGWKCKTLSQLSRHKKIMHDVDMSIPRPAPKAPQSPELKAQPVPVELHEDAKPIVAGGYVCPHEDCTFGRNGSRWSGKRAEALREHLLSCHDEEE